MQEAAGRIVVRSVEGRYLTEITSNHGNISVHSEVPTSRIENLRTPYAARILEARKVLGSSAEYSDYSEAMMFFGIVNKIGAAIMFNIFQKDLPRVTELLLKILSVPDAAEPPFRFLPTLEVDDGGLFFPIETMPLLNTSDPSAGASDWQQAARSFIGMSAGISHVSQHTKHGNSQLNAAGDLSVRLFYDSTLVGAREELSYFQEHPTLKLHDIWPKGRFEARMGTVTRISNWLARLKSGPQAPQVPAPNASAQIARHLLLYPDASTPPQSDILHFSCHYGKDDSTLDHGFSFCGQGDTPQSVMMLDLEAELALLLQANGSVPQRARLSPLIFLNACATGPSAANDFIDVKRTFIGLGHRGVIVTETSMPDAYASAFSRRFYHGLTAAGVASPQERSVGAAMHQAKWDTLRVGKNPLGLLYNLRGDPDLTCI